MEDQSVMELSGLLTRASWEEAKTALRKVLIYMDVSPKGCWKKEDLEWLYDSYKAQDQVITDFIKTMDELREIEE